MSRIHEALKRAEQERAATQTAEKLEERIAASSIVQSRVPPPEISDTLILDTSEIPKTNSEIRPEILQFEEICANCSKPQWKPNPDFLVFSNPNPFHPGAEQFRTLRSRLYRMRESQPLQVILVSSAIPAEGKTLVAANLAHAMVRQKGCRVLLIDADLRSPRAHFLLGAPPTPGLADYLQNGAGIMEVIQQGQEQGFCFVPAGNNVTHPSELISSDRMKQFLDLVKPAFDWVIIDSPPALPVADASVLGGLTDGLLFVVRANSTSSVISQKACKELRDTHILGVVLNTADQVSEYGSYYSNTAYGQPLAEVKKR